MTCFAYNAKSALVTLLIFFSDNSVTSIGQYETKAQCQKVVERILENGIGGGAQFLCFDPEAK